MKVGVSSIDMFDWNEEEISNIIWGGAEESDDHIVPYPERDEEDGHKNSQKQESSAIKHMEKRFLGTKFDFHAIRPESSSASSRNGGVSPSGLDSWPDMASSNDTRMDIALMDNEVFGDSALIKNYSSKDLGSQDEEITNFVEYGWENIGSFDDLDRIFGNHEPMFASVTLGNSDKIWSACKYTTDSPPKGNSDKIWSACKYTTDSPPKSFSINANSPLMGSEMLSKTSEDMGVNFKYGKHDRRSPDLSFEKMDNSVSLTLHLKDEASDIADGSRGESKILVEKVKGHSTSSAIVADNTLNLNEFVDKVVLPGYEITSSEIDSAVKRISSYRKPSPMAPQENIAKLRKRRQMQAMLAIHGQLQQLGNPVSRDFSTQLSAPESPNELPDGFNDQFDNLNALPSIDLSSSNEQDESSVLSAAENGYSAEETVLHQLHEVVSKLDSAIRISIRDSLFRLAKSAVQRQETTDVSARPNGGKQPRVPLEEESDAKREVKATDVETDTNPRDRAVAHLLFHRPTENSPKHPETPEASKSAKLNLCRQPEGGHNLEKLESGKSSQTKLNFSTGEQKVDCMDTSENGPEHITLEAGAMEGVASQ